MTSSGWRTTQDTKPLTLPAMRSEVGIRKLLRTAFAVLYLESMSVDMSASSNCNMTAEDADTVQVMMDQSSTADKISFYI